MTAHIAGSKLSEEGGVTCAVIAAHIEHVRWGLMSAMLKASFLRVASDRADFVDNAALFGADVYAAFPSARFDITEAGNCLAAECNTAAVFHLMRAVEWGLRAFGGHLGVRKLKSRRKGGKTKLTPLSYSDWEHILNGLQTSVDVKVQRMKRGKDKQDAQEFYYPALQDLRGLRDAWRNHVMHTRREYSSPEADAVFGHVKRLMTTLALRVRE